MSSASLCRTDAYRSAGPLTFDPEGRPTATYTKTTFAEKTHSGEKLFVETDADSSFLLLSPRRIVLFSSWKRSFEKPRGEACRTFLPQMMAAPKPTKEYIFRPPICRRQFSRWKAYYWHLLFLFPSYDQYCMWILRILTLVSCRWLVGSATCALLSPHDWFVLL